VGLELRRRERTLWPEARIEHFRTRRGAEVDFAESRSCRSIHFWRHCLADRIVVRA
jgi:hypothetical protein